MLRLIITFFCSLFITSVALAQNKHTYAGITLLEKATLPICPVANDLIAPNSTSKPNKNVVVLYAAYKKDCLYPVFSNEKSSRYIVLSKSHHRFTQNIPIESALVDLDENNRVFMITLFFDTSQYITLLDFIENKYGIVREATVKGSNIQSAWYLDDRTSILLSNIEEDPYSEQKYTRLALLNFRH